MDFIKSVSSKFSINLLPYLPFLPFSFSKSLELDESFSSLSSVYHIQFLTTPDTHFSSFSQDALPSFAFLSFSSFLHYVTNIKENLSGEGPDKDKTITPVVFVDGYEHIDNKHINTIIKNQFLKCMYRRKKEILSNNADKIENPLVSYPDYIYLMNSLLTYYKCWDSLFLSPHSDLAHFVETTSKIVPVAAVRSQIYNISAVVQNADFPERLQFDFLSRFIQLESSLEKESSLSLTPFFFHSASRPSISSLCQPFDRTSDMFLSIFLSPLYINSVIEIMFLTLSENENTYKPVNNLGDKNIPMFLLEDNITSSILQSSNDHTLFLAILRSKIISSLLSALLKLNKNENPTTEIQIPLSLPLDVLISTLTFIIMSSSLQTNFPSSNYFNALNSLVSLLLTDVNKKNLFCNLNQL
jgi:hypothetical protein